MWSWIEGPPQKSQPHEGNQAWLFGPLFHQEGFSSHSQNVVEIILYYQTHT